jgi:type 1 glutamine amidotransferase
MLVKLIKWILIVAAVLVIAAFAFLRFTGAWNVVFPSTTHDTVAPQLPDDMNSHSVLIFSKTNSFRHVEGITGGQNTLREIVLDEGWGFFMTENGAVFNDADLSRFKAVVFLHASGDMLSADQELAFQRWMEAGGGWLGIHAAGDGSHQEWQWYIDNLIGADFTAHPMGPQFQTGEVVTENHEHPVNKGMPSVWEHSEEWYSWEKSSRARGMNILATLNEDSYNPVQKMFGGETDLHMGDHPVNWSNCVGEGRSVYTAVGHQAEAFDQPDIRRLLRNSLKWVMGITNPGC